MAKKKLTSTKKTITKCKAKKEKPQLHCLLCNANLDADDEEGNLCECCSHNNADLFCDACLTQCSGCVGNFCGGCASVSQCVDCSTKYCESCMGEAYCSKCNDGHYCTECLPSHEDGCMSECSEESSEE